MAALDVRAASVASVLLPTARASNPHPGRRAHPLNVLTVTYPGGRTRQFSLRPELVPQVRHWLENYKNLREALEEICELNHHLLRRDQAPAKRGGKRA